jgi:hypothetical protein
MILIRKIHILAFKIQIIFALNIKTHIPSSLIILVLSICLLVKKIPILTNKIIFELKFKTETHIPLIQMISKVWFRQFHCATYERKYKTK